MKTPLVIGIAGGSGAGKHRVIQEYLLPALRGKALIIEHDWYYHELPILYAAQGVTEREDINYDQPEAYENGALAVHLDALTRCEQAEIHPYRKGIGMRAETSVLLEPQDVIIVDGMMLFAVPQLVTRMDMRVFVEADDDVRLRRRIERDLPFSSEEESRLRFVRDVSPAHSKYVEPSRIHAHFILQNTREGKPPIGFDAFLGELLQTILDLGHPTHHPLV